LAAYAIRYTRAYWQSRDPIGGIIKIGYPFPVEPPLFAPRVD
jgi:hypothetical protein